MNVQIEGLRLKQMPRIMEGENNKVFFCADDVIATCAAFMEREYEYMYYDALSFSYFVDAQENIGNCIQIDEIFRGNSFRDNLRKYCGLMMKPIDCKDEKVVTQIQMKIAENIPVIMIMNAFYCPWDYRYNVLDDGGHTVIIKEIDLVNKCMICMDPYYQKDDLVLAFDDFFRGVIELLVLEKIDVLPFFEEREEVLKRVDSAARYKCAQVYERLCQDIEQKFDYEKEIQDYRNDYNYSLDELQKRTSMLQCFQKISNNRQRYGVFLTYLGKRNNERNTEIEDLVCKCLCIAKKWDMLRMMLLKYLLLKDNQKIREYVSGKLAEIKEDELRFMTGLDDVFCGKEKSYAEIVDFNEAEVNQYIQIDISAICNNIGIGTTGSETANLDDAGSFFLQTEILERGVLSFRQIPFEIFRNNKCDNVRCRGQSVLVPNRTYQCIYFFGCSEWGDFEDKFIFEFEDGSRIEKNVEFANWTPDMRNTTNDVVYIGPIVKRYQGTNYVINNPHRLYVRRIPLLCEKVLCKIVLPTMENIHIFSIVGGST